jgi:hypothetical protein
VAGVRNIVPLNHPWVDAARRVGTNLGIGDKDLRRQMAAETAAPPKD